MQKIASFSINHDILQKRMYVSRVDGDVVTYDIRMKRPNQDEYLSNGSLHSFEHLFATYARNTDLAEGIVYIGPMGCRTGFYVLLRDTIPPTAALELIQDSFTFIKEFEGEIPGTKPAECGNYLEHDLAGAKAAAIDMFAVFKDWTTGDIIYEA